MTRWLMSAVDVDDCGVCLAHVFDTLVVERGAGGLLGHLVPGSFWLFLILDPFSGHHSLP